MIYVDIPVRETVLSRTSFVDVQSVKSMWLKDAEILETKIASLERQVERLSEALLAAGMRPHHVQAIRDEA